MHKGKAIAAAEAKATKEGHVYAVISLGGGDYRVRQLTSHARGVMTMELPTERAVAVGVAFPLSAGGYRALPELEP